MAASRYWKWAIWSLVFLSVVSLYFLNARVSDTHAMKARADIGGFREALEAFKKDHGRYPTGDESLDVLVDTPSSRAYLPSRHAIVDPWGDQYVYRPLPEQGGFQLYSSGPNRIDEHGHGDDIGQPLVR